MINFVDIIENSSKFLLNRNHLKDQNMVLIELSINLTVKNLRKMQISFVICNIRLKINIEMKIWNKKKSKISLKKQKILIIIP